MGWSEARSSSMTRFGRVWAGSMAVRRRTVLLSASQGPGAEGDADDEQSHAHVAEALEALPPGLEGRCHALEENNEDESRGKTRGEAIGARLKGRQIEEARASRVLRNHEDVICHGASPMILGLSPCGGGGEGGGPFMSVAWYEAARVQGTDGERWPRLEHKLGRVDQC